MDTVFLKVNEAAGLLKVHPKTIRRWVEEGIFKNAIRQGSTIRIPMSDIDSLKGNQAS